MDQQNTDVQKNMHAESDTPVEETFIEIQVVKPTKKSTSSETMIFKTFNGIVFYNKLM